MLDRNVAETVETLVERTVSSVYELAVVVVEKVVIDVVVVC